MFRALQHPQLRRGWQRLQGPQTSGKIFCIYFSPNCVEISPTRKVGAKSVGRKKKKQYCRGPNCTTVDLTCSNVELISQYISVVEDINCGVGKCIMGRTCSISGRPTQLVLCLPIAEWAPAPVISRSRPGGALSSSPMTKQNGQEKRTSLLPLLNHWFAFCRFSLRSILCTAS